MLLVDRSVWWSVPVLAGPITRSALVAYAPGPTPRGGQRRVESGQLSVAYRFLGHTISDHDAAAGGTHLPIPEDAVCCGKCGQVVVHASHNSSSLHPPPVKNTASVAKKQAHRCLSSGSLGCRAGAVVPAAHGHGRPARPLSTQDWHRVGDATSDASSRPEPARQVPRRARQLSIDCIGLHTTLKEALAATPTTSRTMSKAALLL